MTSRFTSLPGRVPELDAIRGLAAIGVLVYHLPRGFWIGATGVDLFFVLSGYLITSIILRGRSSPGFLRRFVIRRSLRIWPIYYIALAAVLLLNLARRHPEPATGAVWYALYLQNVWEYWGGSGGSVPNFGHTWTLAIEEQFYLMWPLMLFAWRSPVVFRVLVVLGCGLSALVRMGGTPSNLLLTHLDPLLLGAALAAYWQGRAIDHDPRRERLMFAGVLSAATFVYVAMAWLYARDGSDVHRLLDTSSSVGVIAVVYFGVVGLILSLAGSNGTRFLRHPLLVYLGQISYGLYLYHWIVYEWLDHFVKFGLGLGDPYWLDLAKLAVTGVVAVLSWEYVERPILAYKDRVA